MIKASACQVSEVIVLTCIVFFFLISGVWSLPVVRLGGQETWRQQAELFWHWGVFRIQGKFVLVLQR